METNGKRKKRLLLGFQHQMKCSSFSHASHTRRQHERLYCNFRINCTARFLYVLHLFIFSRQKISFEWFSRFCFFGLEKLKNELSEKRVFLFGLIKTKQEINFQHIKGIFFFIDL